MQGLRYDHDELEHIRLLDKLHFLMHFDSIREGCAVSKKVASPTLVPLLETLRNTFAPIFLGFPVLLTFILPVLFLFQPFFRIKDADETEPVVPGAEADIATRGGSEK